uniref:hypothetical protein n=1 Tax=Flavobacterium sp. TaxID=239 RepID=UPI0040479E8E
EKYSLLFFGLVSVVRMRLICFEINSDTVSKKTFFSFNISSSLEKSSVLKLSSKRLNNSCNCISTDLRSRI